jgi:hypothetical protein
MEYPYCPPEGKSSPINRSCGLIKAVKAEKLAVLPRRTIFLIDRYQPLLLERTFTSYR